MLHNTELILISLLEAKNFTGENGKVSGINFGKLDWTDPDKNGQRKFVGVPRENIFIKVDLVLVAMGFLHVEHGNLVKELNIATDTRGNIVVDKDYKTTEPGFFATGDSMTGASLVVRAINHGRRVADSVNQFLKRN